MKDNLIGKRVRGIGTVGVAKNKYVIGKLSKNTHGYIIEDENNRNIPCSVDSSSILEISEAITSLQNKDFDLKKFKTFVSTYKESDAPLNADTFIRDMIYCIGVSVDEKYEYGTGFKTFSKIVKELLDDSSSKGE